jgi:ABC-type multidrug transport system fused ATPase/permease subunit
MRRAIPAPPPASGNRLTAFFGVFRYSRRALALVWQTSRPLTLGLAVCTLVAGVLPAVAAWIGQLIVDAVVEAMAYHRETGATLTFESAWPVLRYVLAEAGVIAAIALAQRGLSAQQSLLRALLGQKVNVMILEKAGTLSLAQFEDSEFYDKLTRARREASIRPLGLVNKTFSLLQNAISLVSFGVLLVQFSPWAILILVIGALCRCSSPRPSSPATPSACSAGAHPRPACRCTWKPCWPGRTVSRRSSCSALSRCCWSAIARSSRRSTAKTAA